MVPSRIARLEWTLAVLFVGLFLWLAWTTWGGLLVVPFLFGASLILFLVYLLLMIMIRQHRERYAKGFALKSSEAWGYPDDYSP